MEPVAGELAGRAPRAHSLRPPRSLHRLSHLSDWPRSDPATAVAGSRRGRLKRLHAHVSVHQWGCQQRQFGHSPRLVGCSAPHPHGHPAPRSAVAGHPPHWGGHRRGRADQTRHHRPPPPRMGHILHLPMGGSESASQPVSQSANPQSAIRNPQSAIPASSRFSSFSRPIRPHGRACRADCGLVVRPQYPALRRFARLERLYRCAGRARNGRAPRPTVARALGLHARLLGTLRRGQHSPLDMGLPPTQWAGGRGRVGVRLVSWAVASHGGAGEQRSRGAEGTRPPIRIPHSAFRNRVASQFCCASLPPHRLPTLLGRCRLRPRPMGYHHMVIAGAAGLYSHLHA